MSQEFARDWYLRCDFTLFVCCSVWSDEVEGNFVLFIVALFRTCELQKTPRGSVECLLFLYRFIDFSVRGRSDSCFWCWINVGDDVVRATFIDNAEFRDLGDTGNSFEYCAINERSGKDLFVENKQFGYGSLRLSYDFDFDPIKES